MRRYSMRCLKAIEALAGGRQAFADRLGVSVPCIARWYWEGEIAKNSILKVLEIAPGKFSAEELLGKWDTDHDDGQSDTDD